MLLNKPLVRYHSYDNRIQFPPKISSSILNEFGAAVKLWKLKRPFDLLTIDFNSVEKPYPNGMLGIL